MSARARRVGSALALITCALWLTAGSAGWIKLTSGGMVGLNSIITTFGRYFTTAFQT